MKANVLNQSFNKHNNNPCEMFNLYFNAETLLHVQMWLQSLVDFHYKVDVFFITLNYLPGSSFRARS